MATHTTKTCLAQSRFCPTTVANYQGKFLTNVANTILPRSQFDMAQPGFQPTTLWLDIWSGFELHF